MLVIYPLCLTEGFLYDFITLKNVCLDMFDILANSKKLAALGEVG